MTLDSATQNPYRSPRAAHDEEPKYLPSEYLVTLAATGWTYRRLIVSGPTPAIVEYRTDSTGYESVTVNRTHVTRVMSWWTLAPILKFEIPSAMGSQPAQLEVKSLLLAFIGGIRLSIGDQAVYVEGPWTD